MTAPVFSAAEERLLCRLLDMPTAGPLEVGDTACRLWEAQCAYAAAAADVGFTVVHHAAAEPGVLERDGVPVSVRQAAEKYPWFLDRQPSLVLRLGPALPPDRMVMFNVHLDTVAGWEPARFADGRFHGRGAVDAKGPAVALLAGIRSAVEAEPLLGRDVGVLIQAVSGEEGGAMGVFGTRPLVERGYVGALNVFCEPTDLRYLPRSTASMTAAVRVTGRDSIDDRPEGGHNATVLLGFLAQYLAAALPGRSPDGRVCVAGLETGPLHNKVYGSGRLLLNLSYGTPENGQKVEAALTSLLDAGVAEFARRFGGLPDYARTAAEAASITTLEWRKRGLPALHNSDARWERLLEDDAGLTPWPSSEPSFTCDAIWMQDVPRAFTVVYGPGSLQANNAHASGEFVDVADLESFSAGVARLLTAFAGSTSSPRVLAQSRSDLS